MVKVVLKTERDGELKFPTEGIVLFANGYDRFYCKSCTWQDQFLHFFSYKLKKRWAKSSIFLSLISLKIMVYVKRIFLLEKFFPPIMKIIALISLVKIVLQPQ